MFSDDRLHKVLLDFLLATPRLVKSIFIFVCVGEQLQRSGESPGSGSCPGSEKGHENA